MTRVLVAGVGNVFFGDDGFGVEVARRCGPLPDARVTDFGIRSIHLAFELLEPFELCIVADCMPRGGTPGTLYVVEPELDDAGGLADAHGMDLRVVSCAVRELGGILPRMVIVGCEPASVEPRLGLSASVAAAIPGAVELIRELVESPGGPAS